MNQHRLQQMIFNLFLVVLFSTFANAQSSVVPIIDLKVNGLLGGVQNGKFLDTQATIKTIKAKEDYTIYSFDGTVARILELNKPKKLCPGDFYSLDFGDRDVNFGDQGGTALGTGYDWNPLPRIAKPIGPANAEYKKIVSVFLRTRGIAQPIVNLTQAVRIDLEGDGQEEVLLTATRIVSYTEKYQKKRYDEYSVVLLRKIINGKPRTIFLAGDVILKNRYEYDGDESFISSILDLNGDGNMEIVIYQQYQEGSSARVFEMVRSKAVEVKSLNTADGGECY